VARVGRAIVSAGCAALLAAVGFIVWPLPAGLLDYRKMVSLRVLDRQGGLLRELRSGADGRETPLAAEGIPTWVRQSFIAAEDARFEAHPGLDALGLARAAEHDLRAGAAVEGGSTLTQQLARMLVPRQRTMLGKVQEALWALRLEAHLPKDEILAQYLNRAPLGNGAVGVEAAARLYFGREARLLSLGEAAALAALPRGPTAYNPYRAPERLRARQQWVLHRMEALRFVSPDEADRASREPLDLQAPASAFRAPHFVQFVARRAPADAALIETSIDPALQQAVEEIVTDELRRLRDRRVSSASAIVVDNESGEVIAYVGSPDFFDDAIDGQNDGVQMTRQPGSALKPFAYAEALRSGFTAATLLPDVEAHFADGQGDYAPKNYDRRSHGPVRLREALANSYNVPAVRVAEALGPTRLLGVLRRAGFDALEETPGYYGLGLVLGDGEVSLWEAARAYAGLSRGGLLTALRPIRRALRADGSEITLADELQPRRFADSRAVAIVTDILSDNAARARAFGLDNALRFPFAVAAKTGTSKGYSDNWTLGYTRERTVGVWAGNFDGTPMIQVSGVSGAGPIFHRVMRAAMREGVPQALVARDRFERVGICPLSGLRAGPACPSAMDEIFVPGTAPKQTCGMHRHLSAGLPPSLAKRCGEAARGSGRVLDLGPDYGAWARAEGRVSDPELEALCAGAGSGAEDSGPEIIYPPRGADFALLPDLPLADQTVPVRLRAGPTGGSLEVRLDGKPALLLDPPYTGRVPARVGEHRLALFRQGDARPLWESAFRVLGGQPARASAMQ
jgi:penicillin-binding protein 1C